ncbi:peroxisomal biogenesis factor 2 [Podospora australis]|uniref:Peroxisomal biogenesis factor 2 n=1 Tax=Podospora australis TaxID=1536484 RepID=A0AAN7AMR0_9PEZI|nr:peroxisomal biogenesis factor 2 [Podospora australis]
MSDDTKPPAAPAPSGSTTSPPRPVAAAEPPTVPTPPPSIPTTTPSSTTAVIPTTNNTFAQAQARLAARRLARETESHTRALAQQSASQLRARIASSQSPLLRRLGASTLSLWDTISSREGTRPAFRVGQVDAELLDEELVQLLKSQVGDAVRYLGGSTLQHDFEPEISFLLRAVLFKLTVWDHDATYGAALQNLRYTDARHGLSTSSGVLIPPTKWQKGIYGLVTVGGRYLWQKWENWLVEQDSPGDFDDDGEPNPRIQTLSKLTERLSTVHAAAAFASFCVFLLQGRYRTLLDRILKMRLAPPTSQVSREVSFEYLNRQLVWHAFTEFLLFVLPLVGINRWRRWLARTWRKTKKVLSSSSEKEGGGEKKGEFAFLPERTCAICYQDQNSVTDENELVGGGQQKAAGMVGSAQTDVTNPYETIPCGCVYCFVCLATRIEREEGEGWGCVRCGETVKECKPWNGDVLEPEVKSPVQKTVVFADDIVGGLEEEEEESSQVLVEREDGGDERNSSSGEEEEEGGEEEEEKEEEEEEEEETPSVDSDQAFDNDDSEGSESEDYEAEEDALGNDLDD